MVRSASADGAPQSLPLPSPQLDVIGEGEGDAAEDDTAEAVEEEVVVGFTPMLPLAKPKAPKAALSKYHASLGRRHMCCCCDPYP
jgi:hypothetical protein